MPHTQTPNSIKNIYIGTVSATESEQLPTPINEEVLLIDGYSTDIKKKIHNYYFNMKGQIFVQI